jgi:hypothetical protein
MKKIVFSLMVVAALSLSSKIVAQDNAIKECCKEKEKKEKCEKTESKDTVKTEKTVNRKNSGSADKKNTASTDKKENCVVKKETSIENKSCGKKS